MSTTVNKKAFTVEKEGKTLNLVASRPNPKVQQEANLVYAKAFADFVKAGAILEAKLDSFIASQNLWDEDKQKEYQKLYDSYIANEKLISGKVAGVKLSEAREAAIKMILDRGAMTSMDKRDSLRQNTVEGQAETVRFNFYVSACTKYADSGNPYFKDYNDYMSRDDDDPVVIKASNTFSELMYNYDPNALKKLPEYAFLLKYGFCNEDLKLVKKVDGKERFVDTKNNLINDKGQRVNEKDELVDDNGDVIVVDNTVHEFVEG